MLPAWRPAAQPGSHDRTLSRTVRLQAEPAPKCGRTADESRGGEGGRSNPVVCLLSCCTCQLQDSRVRWTPSKPGCQLLQQAVPDTSQQASPIWDRPAQASGRASAPAGCAACRGHPAAVNPGDHAAQLICLTTDRHRSGTGCPCLQSQHACMQAIGGDTLRRWSP